MPNIDFFQFFRYALGTIVTIYGTVISIQGLWHWYTFLAGKDKYIGLVRRYVIVHGLRLRFTAFWGDVVICLLLSVACILIWRAHAEIFKLGAAYRSLQPVQTSAQIVHR